ncbi:T-cell surface glycoprotein CD3 zeta chain-like isoform X2 [Synchiropus splendidus]|uniref:T-cell surface glycoprotein CD3 zeta chain-like isoform X2 n=1 Tax=Synchiropus splendidus TaxID=270530 RepID=UPI00237D76FF|nr:T-cell surface glycoprotein CD3 zeta chain-like isoform X2 [Synchiropus splendidus]
MNMFKSCLLMELLVPVTCSGTSLAHQNTCYILDGILIVYCIVVTALLFREKEGGEGLYQELVREGNADQYEVLNPLRARATKEKTKSTEDK